MVAPFVNVLFFGSALSFMMVYVWARRNPHARMNFLGVFQFSAPYLPWVLLGFSALVGQSLITDILGIIVGHLYYFLEDVWVALAAARGWRCRRVLHTPRILHLLTGTTPPAPALPPGPVAAPNVVRDAGRRDAGAGQAQEAPAEPRIQFEQAPFIPEDEFGPAGAQDARVGALARRGVRLARPADVLAGAAGANAWEAPAPEDLGSSDDDSSSDGEDVPRARVEREERGPGGARR